MSGKVFVDSNIWLYSLIQPDGKMADVRTEPSSLAAQAETAIFTQI